MRMLSFSSQSLGLRGCCIEPRITFQGVRGSLLLLHEHYFDSVVIAEISLVVHDEQLLQRTMRVGY